MKKLTTREYIEVACGETRISIIILNESTKLTLLLIDLILHFGKIFNGYPALYAAHGKSLSDIAKHR